jgi:lipopolysaccharide transport system ATP-binding protein
MENIIEIENISKVYNLKQVGSGTLHEDLTNFFGRLLKRTQRDQIEENNRETKGGHLVWALKDISFNVKPGEVIGIIGNNGAGKSTLLKILSQITSPTSGKIKIRGKISSLLEVGTGFHPDLTGRENIYLNGAILGMKTNEIKRQMDEIVSFAGVERYLDTPVKRYSSGMVVRLGFAVAAHLNTDVLIVDEVLAVGDMEFQKKCLGRMKDFSTSGKTVLFVSHNLLAIEKLTERSILIDRGRVLCDASTKEVLQRYAFQAIQNRFSPTKRSGYGNFFVSDVKFNSGNPMYCGAEAQFQVHVDSSSKKIANTPLRCAIAFDNSLGSRIVIFDTELLGRKFDFNVDCTLLVFKTRRLCLLPGLYSYTIFLESSLGIEDWIIEAGGVEVLPGDFFLSGKLPSSDQGLIAHEFEVINS